MKRSEKSGSVSPVNPFRKDDEDKQLRSSSKTDRELKLPPEKSNEDSSGRRERRLSKASESLRDTFERLDLFSFIIQIN